MHRLKSGGYGPGCGARPPLGGRLPCPSKSRGREAMRKVSWRYRRGKAGTDPDERRSGSRCRSSRGLLSLMAGVHPGGVRWADGGARPVAGQTSQVDVSQGTETRAGLRPSGHAGLTRRVRPWRRPTRWPKRNGSVRSIEVKTIPTLTSLGEGKVLRVPRTDRAARCARGVGVGRGPGFDLDRSLRQRTGLGTCPPGEGVRES